MISVLLFVMAGMMLLGAIGTLLLVGKPRKPMTPRMATTTAVISLVYMAILIIAGIQLIGAGA